VGRQNDTQPRRPSRPDATTPKHNPQQAATLASLGLGLLVTFQERLIYLPRIPGVPDAFPFYPDRFGLEYEDVWLTAGDGTKLHAWLMKPPGSGAPAAAGGAAAGLTTPSSQPSTSRLPVLIFFQENAGNMSMRLPFLRAVVRSLGCAVLAPSYRGYGLSEGTPTEAGLRLDAAAALAHARSRADLDPTRIALFGRSLGGAVALATAAEDVSRSGSGDANGRSNGNGAAAGGAAGSPDPAHHPPLAGVVIENTFLSIETVAPALLPLLRPFFAGPPKALLRRLLRSKWRNDEAAAALAAAGAGATGSAPPVLLLSSLADEMLPPAHMRQLWFALGGEAGEEPGVPLRQEVRGGRGGGGGTSTASAATLSTTTPPPRVRWVAFEDGRHLDAYDACAAQYWPELVRFAREAGFARA
jgi:abhydrolase domain-containing protein 13